MKKIVGYALATAIALPAIAASNPPSTSQLFKTDSILNLEFNTDFNKIKKANENGEWVGEEHDDPKFWSAGTVRDLSNPAKILKAQFRTRGMSNLNDAAFPKLRVEIKDEESLEGSVFDGARNFRVNTHANEKGQNEDSGISANSPYREALLYDLARVLYLETPAYRRASIKYVDENQKLNITRPALIVETNKKIGSRLQAREIDLAELAKRKPTLNPVVGAVFHMFHNMIGNGDVGLAIYDHTSSTEAYRPLFNTFVFERADGTRLPVVYDLNKSMIVLDFVALEGRSNYSAPEFGLDGTTALDVGDLSKLRVRFKADELTRATVFFNKRKAQIFETIRTAAVDEKGRSNARAKVDSFFKALDVFMKYPMITQKDVGFFSDPKLTSSKLKLDPIYETDGTLRLGTPVKILAREGNVLKVAIIDMYFDLKDGESSVGYIKADAAPGMTIPEALLGDVDQRQMIFN